MLKTKRDEVIHLFFIGLISGRFLGFVVISDADDLPL